MPSTSYNVSMIKNAVSEYSREQIREALNEFLQMVYAGSSIQSEAIDPTTGMPPYLTTVQGTRYYDLGSDVRETIAIFTERPQRGYSSLRNRSYPIEYYYGGIGYLQVAIRSQPATISSNATLTFVDDPGSTTANYFHRYYKRYTPILTEDTQIPLPEETHWKMREGVIAMLGAESYGDVGARRQLVEKIILEINNKLSKGAQGKSLKTPWQPEFMASDDFGDEY